MPIELQPRRTTNEDSTRGKEELVSFDRALQNSNQHVEIEGKPEAIRESRFNGVNSNILSGIDLDSDDLSYAAMSLDNSLKSVGERSMSSVTSTIRLGINRAMHDWKILAFGQAISFSVFTIGATASELVYMCDLNAPIFQFSWMYFMLLFHLAYRLIMHYAHKRNEMTQKQEKDKKYVHEELFELQQQQGSGESTQEATATTITIPQQYFPFTSLPLSGPWWVYFALAFLEVEAQYFTILAFRYTTLTSITLLDSLAIPASMVASKLLLKCRYGTAHLIGVCICLIGAAMNILIDIEDVEEGREGDKYQHKVLGDMIAIIGAILLGINDTIIEMVCKKYSPQEFLSMLGFFGTIISISQMLVLEMDEIAMFFNSEATCSKSSGFSLLFAFAIANYLSIIGQSYFLIVSEAALMNLSMLTSDLFSVLFSIFFEANIPRPSFYVALVLIFLGICVYEIGPSPMTKMNKHNPDGVTKDDLRKSKQLLNVFEISVPKKEML